MGFTLAVYGCNPADTSAHMLAVSRDTANAEGFVTDLSAKQTHSSLVKPS